MLQGRQGEQVTGTFLVSWPADVSLRLAAFTHFRVRSTSLHDVNL